MFTGIVEGTAEVTDIVESKTSQSKRITLSFPKELTDNVCIGDSISIEGCCLTVVAVKGHCCQFDVVPETLKRTTLNSLKKGDRVNIERALKADGRLNGHFVQGHIDGVGTISQRIGQPDGSSLVLIQAPDNILKYIIEKGSITVDGVSLTVVAVTKTHFSFALIPHTATVTTLGKQSEGDSVNLEVDILAKYVEKLCKVTE